MHMLCVAYLASANDRGSPHIPMKVFGYQTMQVHGLLHMLTTG